MKNKKFLIITYYWPPYGGTGVYRVLKFTKYLVKQGWEPIILTPKRANSPIVDNNLLNEVPEGTKVYHTSILEPKTGSKKKGVETSNGVVFQKKSKSIKGKFIRWVRLNLFIPDAKIGWYFFAVREGKKIIKKEKPALIFSTSPPPTTSLIAKRLAKWSQLPWVADFRDPWTNINYLHHTRRSSFTKRIDRFLERSVQKNANAITTVNDGFFPHLPQYFEKTITIINGFDRADILGLPATQERNDKFIIRYFGGFKINQYYESFINSLLRLQKNAEINSNLRIEFYGFVDAEIESDIARLGLDKLIIFHNFIPRTELIPLLNDADLVLLFIGQEYKNGAGVSTKIFEYLLLRKEILAIAPLNSKANDIIKETNSGQMFDKEDEEGIFNFLVENYENWRNNTMKSNRNEKNINKYDFEELTKKLISIFEQVIQ